MTELASVAPHLQQRFKDHRIVFWHDPDRQYESTIDNLDLPGVSTIRVAADEFAVKNRLLHEQPKDKFLVYRAGSVPDGIGNWLLDLELAYGIFTADRTALVSQDLGLDGVDEAVAAHEKFFNAASRVQKLKDLLTSDDDAMRLRAKMSAVALSQKEHSLLEITRTLLVENAAGTSAKYDTLVTYGLDDFYWQGVGAIYGYESEEPTIDDFILWIFRVAIDGFASDRPGGLQSIKLDFKSLRDTRRSQEALAVLATRAAKDLDYKARIQDIDFRDLLHTDLFEDAERKIIRDLARAVAEQSIASREVAEVVRVRQESPWVDRYRGLYVAIAAAAELLAILNTINLSLASFDEGLERYRDEWFRVDQLYRHFTNAYRTFEGNSPLDQLRDQVEKRYTNAFVYELGKAWQQQVDLVDRWASAALPSQQTFYRDHVEKLTDDGKKAVVIISDALRYEVAEELGSRIRQEDRFDADLGAMLGVVPSYTQLGMAALLPHQSLRHTPDGKGVLADDQPTNGTKARAKLLEAVSGTAIRAEDFKALGRDQSRELFKSHQVLYLFHDRIDAIGDKPATERQVFEAAEDAIRDLVDLVKRAANANATNIFITADHGFLSQDKELPDQFFLSERAHGDNILIKNRRYVIGHGLKADDAFTTFTAEQLGLSGDIEVQVPKSIHRLRLAGGGSRFVHGGATLQEVVVPVLSVNKKRQSDTRPVNVSVLPETDKITTGQLVVKLFQAEPVSDKVQPRTLRAGLYVGETLISNDPQPQLTFDSTSEEPRDRYQNVQLLLKQDTNDYNNRSVEFRLEERIPRTNQWRVVEKALYTMKRSFTTDFDF